jgi:hypothetical protein
MVFNLPFLGAVHMEEIGILVWMILMCCFFIALFGHCLGCSDPTAPTQNPFCPKKPKLAAKDVESGGKTRAANIAEGAKENLLTPATGVKKTIEDVLNGDEEEGEAETKIDDNNNNNTKKYAKVDPEKKSLEAHAWAEKRKSQIAKAASMRKNGEYAGGERFNSSKELKGPSSSSRSMKEIELDDFGSYESTI